MAEPLLLRAADVRLAVFDVDGVFTDGRLYYGDRGEAFKVFHARDGLGVKLLMAAGVEVAIITGRSSPALARRMEELGVQRIYQGAGDKLEPFTRLLAETGCSAGQSLFTGDDLPDLPVMRAAGLGIAVADAHPEVIAAADLTTRCAGGRGAVREIADLVLSARATDTGVTRSKQE